MSIFHRAMMSAHVTRLRCILQNTSSNPIAAGRLSDVENAGEESRPSLPNDISVQINAVPDMHFVHQPGATGINIFDIYAQT